MDAEKDIVKIPEDFDEALLRCESLEDYQILIEDLKKIVPMTPESWSRIAWVLARVGKPEEAIYILKTRGICLLGYGYLFRLYSFENSSKVDLKKVLLELDSLPKRIGKWSTDLEGLIHLHLAQAMFYVSLNLIETALHHLDRTIYLSDEINLRSARNTANYEYARICFQKQEFGLAALKLKLCLASSEPFHTLHKYASDLYYWSCFLGDLPEENAYEYFFPTGLVKNGSLSLSFTEEIQSLMDLSKDMVNFFDYTHLNFPNLSNTKEEAHILKEKQRLLSIKAETAYNEVAQVMIRIFHMLMLSIIGDTEYRELMSQHINTAYRFPVLRCLSHLSVLQAKVNAGDSQELPEGFIVKVLTEWDKLTSRQRVFMHRYIEKFLPSIPVLLKGILTFPKPQTVMAYVDSTGISIGDELISEQNRRYPIRAIKSLIEKRYQNQMIADFRKASEHKWYCKKYSIARVNYSWLIEPVKELIRENLNRLND